ncbi:hypothetical protein FN846DRAFT_889442 [Sphaerosporella brunnea]|uniref:Uncharacterized protein n=1 Tax=Sphaerosporella brunnea TaxID=1250544 RepID=A0A5J5EZE5_9PEZI|nr:hypothetical protein FN846DRAFT_889442 [Sphaerosporella brunnea]
MGLISGLRLGTGLVAKAGLWTNRRYDIIRNGSILDAPRDSRGSRNEVADDDNDDGNDENEEWRGLSDGRSEEESEGKSREMDKEDDGEDSEEEPEEVNEEGSETRLCVAISGVFWG